MLLGTDDADRFRLQVQWLITDEVFEITEFDVRISGCIKEEVVRATITGTVRATQTWRFQRLARTAAAEVLPDVVRGCEEGTGRNWAGVRNEVPDLLAIVRKEVDVEELSFLVETCDLFGHRFATEKVADTRYRHGGSSPCHQRLLSRYVGRTRGRLLVTAGITQQASSQEKPTEQIDQFTHSVCSAPSLICFGRLSSRKRPEV